MSEEKSHRYRPPAYDQGQTGPRRPVQDGTEQHGWDAYRKWLSRVNTKPAPERTPLDPSIYSWRGYHNWADKVRQTWKSES
jgi:hypothetical protein